MTVSISAEAHQGWRDFAARQGVTMTGLAEALGLNFEVIDTLPPELERAITDARAIDVERRGRQPDPFD